MPAISLSVVAACITAIVAIGGDQTLTLIAEPLQRYGNPAHWTMLFIAIIITTVTAVLIRNEVTTRIFNRVAGYSYTLYVIHFPLLLLAFGLLHPALHSYNWVLSFVAGGIAVTLVLPVAGALASVVENRRLLHETIGTFWKGMNSKAQSAPSPATSVSPPGPDRGRR